MGEKQNSVFVVIDLSQKRKQETEKFPSKSRKAYSGKWERADFRRKHEGCLMSNFQSDFEFYFNTRLLFRNTKRKKQENKNTERIHFSPSRNQIFIKFSHVHCYPALSFVCKEENNNMKADFIDISIRVLLLGIFLT